MPASETILIKIPYVNGHVISHLNLFANLILRDLKLTKVPFGISLTNLSTIFVLGININEPEGISAIVFEMI